MTVQQHGSSHAHIERTFTAVRAALPTANVAAFDAELASIAHGPVINLAELDDFLSGWWRIATRAAQRNVNTVTTNVPGPQFPLYAAGRRMVRAFPYVPLAGQVRLGIAIFSYNGEVNFGITGDYDTTPDIEVLAHGIEDGMAQLLKV